MGKTTDELVSLAHAVSPAPDPRELDMLLSAGERISCALAAMAIVDLGHRAISLTGSQAGIVTDTEHTRAKILEIRGERIRAALDEGAIVLVAGFQGVSTALEVTTLGRGGSDTTAVALAAALDADACEIYTDVDGVFTADPRLVPRARKLDALSYEEMLELAASRREGADAALGRVRPQSWRPHPRAFDVSEADGTWIVSQEELVEQPIISGVAHDTSEAKVTILAVPGPAGDRGARLPDARRRRRQRRHDRAERVDRRAHRHLVHAAEERPAAGRGARSSRSRGRSAPRASRTTRRSRRSRSSARA